MTLLMKDSPTYMLRLLTCALSLMVVIAVSHLIQGIAADPPDMFVIVFSAFAIAVAGFMIFMPALFLWERKTGKSVPDGRGGWTVPERRRGKTESE